MVISQPLHTEAQLHHSSPPTPLPAHAAVEHDVSVGTASRGALTCGGEGGREKHLTPARAHHDAPRPRRVPNGPLPFHGARTNVTHGSGSRGRGFKSRRPDCEDRRSEAVPAFAGTASSVRASAPMMGARGREYSRASSYRQCLFPPSHDRVEVVRGTPLLRAVVNGSPLPRAQECVFARAAATCRSPRAAIPHLARADGA